MPGRGFIPGLAIALTFLATVVGGAGAQGVIDREYEIKAGYLLNFCRYVEWPKHAVPGDEDTFVIGVLGPSPFDRPLLERLASKKVQDKKVVIRQFASVKDYQPCHILFVSAAPDERADESTVEVRVKAVLAKTKGSPVLLVSDTDELAEKGMMINFYIEENTVKLAINRNAAARAGLTIAAPLLNLKIVKLVSGGAESRPQGPEHHALLA
jgi:uncharacterized protein DUF4154